MADGRRSFHASRLVKMPTNSKRGERTPSPDKIEVEQNLFHGDACPAYLRNPDLGTDQDLPLRRERPGGVRRTRSGNRGGGEAGSGGRIGRGQKYAATSGR